MAQFSVSCTVSIWAATEAEAQRIAEEWLETRPYRWDGVDPFFGDDSLFWKGYLREAIASFRDTEAGEEYSSDEVIGLLGANIEKLMDECSKILTGLRAVYPNPYQQYLPDRLGRRAWELQTGDSCREDPPHQQELVQALAKVCNEHSLAGLCLYTTTFLAVC